MSDDTAEIVLPFGRQVHPIVYQCMAQIEEDWRQNGTPAFFIWKAPDGSEPIRAAKRLTVGDCEELCEFHMRRGESAYKRFRKNPASRSSPATAARHFMLARYARCIYCEILGIEKTDSNLPSRTPAETSQTNG
jgi:hypothetical protein